MELLLPTVMHSRLTASWILLTLPGLLQQWIAVDDEQVVEVPKHLSSAESATLSTAGVTAWSAIRESFDAFLTGELREWKEGRRLEGKTILTQGTGGVSCFAIQVRRSIHITPSRTTERYPDRSSPRRHCNRHLFLRHQTRARQTTRRNSRNQLQNSPRLGPRSPAPYERQGS